MLNKSSLKDLLREIETTSEGQLQGGFVILEDGGDGLDPLNNGNCNCDCNCGCTTNGNCDCNCSCSKPTTPAPKNSGIGVAGLMGLTF